MPTTEEDDPQRSIPLALQSLFYKARAPSRLVGRGQVAWIDRSKKGKEQILQLRAQRTAWHIELHPVENLFVAHIVYGVRSLPICFPYIH